MLSTLVGQTQLEIGKVCRCVPVVIENRPTQAEKQPYTDFLSVVFVLGEPLNKALSWCDSYGVTPGLQIGGFDREKAVIDRAQ